MLLSLQNKPSAFSNIISYPILWECIQVNRDTQSIFFISCRCLHMPTLKDPRSLEEKNCSAAVFCFWYFYLFIVLFIKLNTLLSSPHFLLIKQLYFFSLLFKTIWVDPFSVPFQIKFQLPQQWYENYRIWSISNKNTCKWQNWLHQVNWISSSLYCLQVWNNAKTLFV